MEFSSRPIKNVGSRCCWFSFFCCRRVFATWWKNKQRFCCLSRNRRFRLDALDNGPNIIIFFGAAFPFSTTLNILQSFSCWIIHFYMDLHERFRCAMKMYGFIFVKWMNASVCALEFDRSSFRFPSWISFFVILFLIGRITKRSR